MEGKETKLEQESGWQEQAWGSPGTCLHDTYSEREYTELDKPEMTQHKKGGSFKMEGIHLGIKRNVRLEKQFAEWWHEYLSVSSFQWNNHKWWMLLKNTTV